MLTSREILDALAKASVSYVKKPWGEEIIIYPDGVHDLQIKFILVYDGKRTSLQHHPVGREVAFIIGGDGTIVNDKNESLDQTVLTDEIYEHGVSTPIEILPGDLHRSVGPVTLLEFTTAGPLDIVRHEDDYMREGTIGE